MQLIVSPRYILYCVASWDSCSIGTALILNTESFLEHISPQGFARLSPPGPGAGAIMSATKGPKTVHGGRPLLRDYIEGLQSKGVGTELA